MLTDMKIMGVKRYIILLFAVVFCLSGCADLKKIKEIEAGNFRVEAVSPNGLRGLTVNFVVEVDNPASQLSFSEVTGTLERSGKVLGRMTMDPMVLQRRSAEIYHVKAFVSLGEDARLRDLLMLTDMNKLNECTIDVSATPRLKSGLGTPLTIKDISVKKLLENDDNEKN